MTKLTSLLLLAVAVSSFIACSATEATAQNNQTDAESFTNGNTATGAMNTNQNTIVGLVTDVVGNDITIQIGTMAGGAQGSANGGAQGGTDNSAQGGSNIGAQNEGNAPSNEAAQGSRPNADNAQEGASNGENRPSGEGMPSGENMPSGEGSQYAMAGGIGPSNMAEQDYSELVTLTDETKTYSIPVSTPVTQFNSELTFSSIAVDTYISIATDDDGNILSVNVLG